MVIDKKVFLTGQVSAIIQCKTPIKCKDSGYLTITISIVEVIIKRSLLDQGANVNLIPFSPYQKLGNHIIFDYNSKNTEGSGRRHPNLGGQVITPC